jgi:uncharacterized damage-inducible protein DinB
MSTEELIANIEQAGKEYADFIERQSPEALHRRPSEGEWSAAELTGHVAEFPGTFADQARRLAESPGMQIGRAADDPGRLGAVAGMAHASPGEAAAAVTRGVQQALGSLRAIPADGWRVKGKHQRLGEMSVTEVVQHFIADHLRDHLVQAKNAVGS